MSDFAVGTKLSQAARDIQVVSQSMNKLYESSCNVSRQLRGMQDPLMLTIGVKLNLMNIYFLLGKKNMLNAGKQLGEIYAYYQKTERAVAGFRIQDGGNGAFDGKGSYGGNQSDPIDQYGKDPAMQKMLEDIVRRYYPNYSDRQVKNYLTKLESEGCGYMAMVNTVFARYAGREKDFEKTFGFPMRKTNGELNYEGLVTDFYSATDNHNQKGIGKWKQDVISENEDESNTKGWGTTRNSREYRYEKYMRDHGIECDVKNVHVTAKNYDKVSKNGDIVVAVRPCILYDRNGNEVVNIDGGHAMTVTGTTEDGMMKVSSWGKEYYIKPTERAYNYVEYQQIQYK